MFTVNRNRFVRGERTKVQSFALNFGPQHPAAHGILKIAMVVAGELIVRADPQYGLLHRGSEKLCESRSFSQIVPYFDRMDYVANLFQEDSIVSAIESLDSPKRPSLLTLNLRIMLNELSRIMNHLLTMSAICLDLGSMGPIFWAFEERELIMEFFEKLSGARMHTALYRPFQVGVDFLFKNTISDLLILVERGSRVVAGSFLALLSNKTFRSRCAGIGTFSKKKIFSYGIQGVIARACGVSLDSRLGLGSPSYSTYSSLSFRTFLGKKSDCLDRFVVRGREVVESYRLILQCLTLCTGVDQVSLAQRKRSKFISMEGVITHFKETTYTPQNNRALGWACVEGPKGGVGSFVLHTGAVSPYRVHLRSPVAHNLFMLGTVANGYSFADFVSTFCSMDVVLGEIDR